MAIVSINEAQVGGATEGTPEEQSTIKMVGETLSRYKRAREKYDKDWQFNYEFLFGGRQWTINRPAWRFSEVVNLTWANCMTEVGIQTDTRPKVEFDATEPSDFQFAEQLQKINAVNWEKYPWLTRVQDVVTLSKWVHVALALIEWDDKLEGGLGDIAFKILDPFYCFWDPKAHDEQSLDCFIYAGPVPTGELRSKYPNFKEFIKADVDQLQSQSQTGGVISPTSDRASLLGATSTRTMRDVNRFGGEPMTFLIRVWMKDESIEEYENEKEDGTKEYVQQKKYPKGRYIEIACNHVLRDGPFGTLVKGEWIESESDKIPVARMVNYQYPLEFAGEHEITHLKGPQKVYNYVWSHSLDQMKNAGAPKVIIGASSGVDPDNISNEPGQKIIANDVSQVKFEGGTGIASGMQFIMDQAKFGFDSVSGLHDVIKGAVDPSVTSGLLFESYAEAAQVRMRLKNRNLDQFLQRVGQLMLDLYLQFYKAPRVFRITNQEGFPEFVEFYLGQNPAGERTAFVKNGDQPQMAMPAKGTPDVKVISGSALPFAKALKSKTAIDYLTAGVIDREEVLKTVDWPNAQQVLDRMAQADAAAQQAEAQNAVSK